MRSQLKIYDVDVTRDGKWWMIEVPEIGQLTQARRLSEVEDMARSLIAVSEDVSPGSIAIAVRSMISEGVDVLGRQELIVGLRLQIAELESQIREAMHKTAWELTEQQMPVRDIGFALGVSHQRVSQLVNS